MRPLTYPFATQSPFWLIDHWGLSGSALAFYVFSLYAGGSRLPSKFGIFSSKLAMTDLPIRRAGTFHAFSSKLKGGATKKSSLHPLRLIIDLTFVILCGLHHVEEHHLQHKTRVPDHQHSFHFPFCFNHRACAAVPPFLQLHLLLAADKLLEPDAVLVDVRGDLAHEAADDANFRGNRPNCLSISCF